MPPRVIAGSAKGRRLKLVPGDTTRPVMDRVKEALFSIISREIWGTTFLDLFAGTGSIGIEALSRGAEQAVFVDLSGIAIKTIHENLEITKLKEKAVIRRADALSVIRQAPPAIPYDFIYIAPPQYKGLWLETLRLLNTNPGWIGEDTKVIVQIDPKEFQEFTFETLSIYDERRYGKTMLLFLARKEEEQLNE